MQLFNIIKEVKRLSYKLIIIFFVYCRKQSRPINRYYSVGLHKQCNNHNAILQANKCFRLVALRLRCYYNSIIIPILHVCIVVSNYRWTKMCVLFQWYYIKSKKSGLFLEVSNGNGNDGTPLYPQEKKTGKLQKWYTDDDTSTIRTAINGSCLDIEGKAFHCRFRLLFVLYHHNSS